MKKGYQIFFEKDQITKHRWRNDEEHSKSWLSMNVKVYYLHSHLDFFSANFGNMNEEQCECFYQDLEKVETRYQEMSDCFMVADYCWLSKQDCHLLEEPRRKARKKKFTL